ncbi:unnamed protein product [Candida verbasci]|uniref:Uncharacterized protein n=1 Tax=Candida verbasci TaxID=1227364 RepID=A0A9W4TV46_9ASCO|nr:unnamed protein product [Candida verbasci]
MSQCSSISFISSCFSTISCISWICAQLPQIIQNYKNKSARGISLSFLLLWFLGDFLSFTSCLINDKVLQFQIYLSIFFLFNDVTLCFQYWYYNKKSFDKPIYVRVGENPTPLNDDNIKKDNYPIIQKQTPTNMESEPSSYDSTNESNIMKKVIIASSLVSKTNAFQVSQTSNKDILGIILAWSMTIVYCSSRCPQLYKNYKRKAVDGISPYLFAAALIGNLTYTISILTSCEFILSNHEDRINFIYHELPYIIGSSGTVFFDIGYFYQRCLYRTNLDSSTLVLQNWNEINDSNTH